MVRLLSNFLIVSLFIFGCGHKESVFSAEKGKEKISTLVSDGDSTGKKKNFVSVKSLKELQATPPESVIDTCDLSYQQLSKVPILHPYKIKILILSHNKIKGKFDTSNLPSMLEELDISHNNITGSLYLDYYATTLKRVSCQYNKLESLSVPLTAVYVDVSHNQLLAFYLGSENDRSKEGPFPLSYLNISYNPTLVRGLEFNFEEIDTVLSVGTPPLKRATLYF